MNQEPCKKCGEYHNNCYELAELTDEEIAGAVARGWCSEKNSMKVMDSDLAWAIVEEIKAILRKAQEK